MAPPSEMGTLPAPLEGSGLFKLPRRMRLHPGQREQLPVDLPPAESYSVWEIIKPNLGKDFSRFSVPIHLNEPLSFLQRVSENMQYCELLQKANQMDDETDRLELVGAFAVSTLSANLNRLSKPFNPLLLETFELQRDGYKFVSEQVSHHPPVSAFHAESDDYVLSGTVAPKMSFWMNKLICTPNARFNLVLKKSQSEYHWEGPVCQVYNVMIGKMYMNLTGNLSVHCRRSQMEMRLCFDTSSGWNFFKGSDLHVDGFILKGKNKVRGIYGNWTHFMASCDAEKLKSKDGYNEWQKLFKESVKAENEEGERVAILPESTLIWLANRKPPKWDKQYHLSYFALSLNEECAEKKELPPSDARLRPDMRELEEGRMAEATALKEKLEEKQRQRRKENRSGNPKWFDLSKDSSGKEWWKFTGAYWNRCYENVEAIFDV